MRETIINSQQMSKTFRSGMSFTDLLRGRLRGSPVHALRDVNLRVTRGEVVALMGPNGAGKSTLLRLIAGLLIPDQGSLQVLGHDAARSRAAFRRRVCYVVCDERSFSWRLTAVQNLLFFAALHGLPRAAARARVDHTLGLVELQADAHRPVREYSTGMRHRLALARGLLGGPELLLFDELTRGVDPRGAIRLRQLILQELEGTRRTAIIATHDPQEVRQICSRVVTVDGGKIVGEGAPDQVEHLLGLDEDTPEEAAS